MKPSPTRLLGAILCTAILFAGPALAADLRVSSARTAPPLPGTDLMAGYLTLVNTGDTDITVRGASSPDFERLSVHRSMQMDGQSHMMAVESLTLEPGERVALEPGGLHLMMFHPDPRPRAGDTLSVNLRTDAGDVPVEMRVVERAELLGQ